MTGGSDWGRDPFGGNPFGASPPVGGPSGAPPPVGGPSSAPAPSPPLDARPVNTFATLSVVFAFLLAPAGAVLGHLGLSRIRRTGERGRDRALVGLTLSYAITVTAVLALVAWAVVDTDTDTGPPAVAGAPPPTAVAPPPGPVTESELASFPLGLDEVRTLVRNPGLQAQPALTAPRQAPYVAGTAIEPATCAAAQFAGTALAYDGSGYRAMYQITMSSPPVKQAAYSVTQSVAVFTDAAAAQKAGKAYERLWDACGDGVIDWTGAQTTRWDPIGRTGLGLNPTVANFSLTPIPADYDRSISRNFHVKENVLVDIDIFGDHNWEYPLITAILERIPG